MIEDKIKEIEEEIRRTPYNKATQHHIGRLKARLARLREASKAAEEARRASKGGGYSVKKSGDATVILAGLPSVGKSTLLNRLTNAKSKVADYAFTTVSVEPGIMEFKGARMQFLDVPGLVEGASRGKGRGKEVLSVTRSADLVLILIDVFNLKQLDVITRELYNAGIRLDRHQPDVRIKKKTRGGITVNTTVELTSLDEGTIKGILQEYGYHNADIVLREDISVDEFIDAIAGNGVYIPSLIALNKVDLVRDNYLDEVTSELKRDFLPISAATGQNLGDLKEAIYNKLNFIRVYLKPQGGETDFEEPMILVKGSRVGDVCDRLHSNFRDEFRYARIWGTSAKYSGHRVGLEHVLSDEDILTIVSG
ncbi:MAG: OBG GTPase family GTP-binding protein [Candidatus Hydrothermarchaeaceae archaeon]